MIILTARLHKHKFRIEYSTFCYQQEQFVLLSQCLGNLGMRENRGGWRHAPRFARRCRGLKKNPPSLQLGGLKLNFAGREVSRGGTLLASLVAAAALKKKSSGLVSLGPMKSRGA